LWLVKPGAGIDTNSGGQRRTRDERAMCEANVVYVG
jgi:hypothetical protein